MDDNPLKTGDVILLAGYRRHGKDTFYRHCAGVDEGARYIITLDFENIVMPTRPYVRLAFADILKEECARILNMSFDELERDKDEPLRADYAFKSTVPRCSPPTVRDVLIDEGAYRRSTERGYYARKVCEKLFDTSDSITIITDFRFPLEYEYLREHLAGSGRRLITAWLHRDGAPVSPASDVTEHMLDDFTFQMRINCV